jgi:hypothetical protein
MSISDVIIANQISVGIEEPHGIIYKIREAVTNNNILNFVQPTTNYHENGNIETVVKWDSAWAGQNNKNTYLLIDFKDRFIFPTHYSMKGRKGHYFAKDWVLYGLNSTAGFSVEISRNTGTGSSFCCSNSTCGIGCYSDDWGTFKINSPTHSFRYLKLMSLAPSDPSYWYMTLKGFEVFGILSKDGRVSLPEETHHFKSCLTHSYLPAYAFLRLFSVYISI